LKVDFIDSDSGRPEGFDRRIHTRLVRLGYDKAQRKPDVAEALDRFRHSRSDRRNTYRAAALGAWKTPWAVTARGCWTEAVVAAV
jgi:hypothetical protein